MVSTKKDPVLAVVSLSGGNDGLNPVQPNNPNYRDYRPTLEYPKTRLCPSLASWVSIRHLPR